MFDQGAPTSVRALEEYEKPGVKGILLRIAVLSARDAAAADDLLQNAMVRVLDPEDFPWKDGKFLTHMRLVLRNTWYKMNRRKMAQEMAEETVTAGDRSISREPRPDDEAERRRWLQDHLPLGEELRAELQLGYPLAADCFDLACTGLDEPADQAAALGQPVEAIYKAHADMKRLGARIKQAWEHTREQRQRQVLEEIQKRRQGGGAR